MELRIHRTWSYVVDNHGRLGGPLQYKLVHHDELQYKDQSWSSVWRPVPIVEAEKPMHPDDIKRKNDLTEFDNVIQKAIQDGTIKLPNLDLGKPE